jgi:cytochrome c biogenesis protein CcmG, thiol:disulfide interchange protein DsbE
MKKAFTFFIGSVLLVGLAGCANQGKQLAAKSFLNQKAPELVVEKWITPPPDTKGKFVLVDFWATWCPPCRRAIPELNTFQKKFADKLVVIGISDETEAEVQKLRDPKIEYAVAIDTQARTKKEVQVEGIPHIMLMDPSGVVRWEGYPFQEGFELTEKVIQDILNPPAHQP